MSSTSLGNPYNELVFEAMRGAGRPDGYYLESKERVPGVTTVDSCEHPRGLFYWYWEKGKDGYDFSENPTPAKEIGTLVHRMVEKRIHGEVIPQIEVDDPMFPAVMSAYNAFVRWFDGNKFKVLATEVPLVSEVHRYGGTIDAILLNSDNELCLGDWKTSNSIHVDYLVQMSAYGELWNENAPEGYSLTGGFHLVRFGKENGDMEHRHFPNLDDAFEKFLHLRAIYELNKGLRRRAK